jgi:hypothetical protein
MTQRRTASRCLPGLVETEGRPGYRPAYHSERNLMGFLDRLRNRRGQRPMASPHTEPWRDVYQTLIDRYSFLAGAHMRHAELTNTEFTPVGPLAALLKKHSPDLSEEQIQVRLGKWKRAFDNARHHDLVTELLNELGASKGSLRGAELGRLAVERMLQADNYNGYLVRYVIGEILDRDFGPATKRRYYWLAILTREIT